MKRINFISLVAAFLALAPQTQAGRSGSEPYVPGATATFIDALPDNSGFAAENICLNYSSTNYNAFHGLPLDVNSALNLNANFYTFYTDTILAFYTFEPKVFGGHYAIAMVIPDAWSGVIARKDTMTRPVGPVSASRLGWMTGKGDIEFWPFMLGWNKSEFNYDVRLAIYAPGDQYEAGHLVNVGSGYSTFEPQVAVSWLSSRIGTEISALSGVDFNTENTTADYQPGDIFHVDTTVAQRLPFLGGFAGVGVNGYYLKQISAGSGAGAKVASFGNKSTGVGPLVYYMHDIGKRQLVFEAKWRPQINVNNTARWSFIWVKFALIF